MEESLRSIYDELIGGSHPDDIMNVFKQVLRKTILQRKGQPGFVANFVELLIDHEIYLEYLSFDDYKEIANLLFVGDEDDNSISKEALYHFAFLYWTWRKKVITRQEKAEIREHYSTLCGGSIWTGPSHVITKYDEIG